MDVDSISSSQLWERLIAKDTRSSKWRSEEMEDGSLTRCNKKIQKSSKIFRLIQIVQIAIVLDLSSHPFITTVGIR